MKDKRNTAKTANQDIMHWIREGGLFVIVCNLITVFKYILLQFLPAAFANMPKVDFGWPGIEVTMLGATFKWNILGYDAEHGGLPYFCAYMIAMILGEVINFVRKKCRFPQQGESYLADRLVCGCILRNNLYCKFYKLHLGRNSCAICAGFYLQYWYNGIERRCFHGNLLFRQQGHFPNQRLRRRLLSSTGIT